MADLFLRTRMQEISAETILEVNVEFHSLSFWLSESRTNTFKNTATPFNLYKIHQPNRVIMSKAYVQVQKEANQSAGWLACVCHLEEREQPYVHPDVKRTKMAGFHWCWLVTTDGLLSNTVGMHSTAASHGQVCLSKKKLSFSNHIA